jgi:NAD dependent epimerase/dehydratase family enzyme
VVWQPERGVIDAAGLEGHDVVIHLAGESIAGVWTAAKKRGIRDSPVLGTALLACTLAGLREPPQVLFAASAMGIYGSHPPERAVDESVPPGSGFLAKVGVAWEAAARPAADAGIRVVHMRLGNVLGRARGWCRAGSSIRATRSGSRRSSRRCAACSGSGYMSWSSAVVQHPIGHGYHANSSSSCHAQRTDPRPAWVACGLNSTRLQRC